MASIMVFTAVSAVMAFDDESDANLMRVDLGPGIDGQTIKINVGDRLTIYGGTKNVQYPGYWFSESNILSMRSGSVPSWLELSDCAAPNQNVGYLYQKAQGYAPEVGRWTIEYEVHKSPIENPKLTRSFYVEVSGFDVTYHANNGSGESTTVSAEPNLTFQKCNFAPDEGMEFAGWSLSSSGGTLYDPGDTINISGETNIYAQWIAAAEPPKASFTISTDDSTVTLNAKGSQYAESYKWDFGDGYTSTRSITTHTYSEPGTYTITLTVRNEAGSDTASRSVTITAPEPENVYLQISAGTGGNVTGGGYVVKGSSTQITATPDSGYEFAHWSDGNTQNPRTVTVNSNMSLSATFEKTEIPVEKHTLSLSAGYGGNVFGNGSYVHGSTAVISATPDSGYKFVKWSDGNTQNPRNVTVNFNMSLSATFEKVEDPIKSVTATITPGHGGATAGSGTYTEGTTITISASPDTGYKFVKWSDGNTDNPRTITLGGSNVTLNAEFKEIVKPSIKFNIQVTPSIGGAVHGSGSYEANSTALIFATAAEGFIFVKWSDGNTDNPRTVYVTQNASYVALFKEVGSTLITHSIVLTSNEGGTLIGNGEYTPGTSVTIHAQPNIGYKFVKWSDGSTDEKRTILIGGDVVLEATFEKSILGGSSNTMLIVVAVFAVIALFVGLFITPVAYIAAAALGVITVLMWWFQ